MTSPVLQTEQVEPALEQTDFIWNVDSDMFYLFWPGTQVPRPQTTRSHGRFVPTSRDEAGFRIDTAKVAQ